MSHYFIRTCPIQFAYLEKNLLLIVLSVPNKVNETILSICLFPYLGGRSGKDDATILVGN
jgi:hypothetical protein